LLGALKKFWYYDCHDNGFVVIIVDAQVEKPSSAALVIDPVDMVYVQLEVAVSLADDVADLGVSAVVGIEVAAAGDLVDQEVGKKEMLDGKNDVQGLLQLVTALGTYPFAF
jgi:hypothetical protein